MVNKMVNKMDEETLNERRKLYMSKWSIEIRGLLGIAIDLEKEEHDEIVVMIFRLLELLEHSADERMRITKENCDELYRIGDK